MEAFTILHSSDNPCKKDKTFQTKSGLDQHKRYKQGRQKLFEEGFKQNHKLCSIILAT
jgi:hypothetical protein